MAKIKTLKVKAIKVQVVEFDVSHFNYAEDFLPLNGKTQITAQESPNDFDLLEFLFEDEHETVRYDQIEVTEL